ncbi:hypothetical protein LC609_37070 [Nostoc sp. XA013]|nr:hypothetical protein [Nostoc sp. XA013]
MIDQHLQPAIPSVSFANAELQEFIDNRPDAREVRKALAVKLVHKTQLRIFGYKLKPGCGVSVL